MKPHQKYKHRQIRNPRVKSKKYRDGVIGQGICQKAEAKLDVGPVFLPLNSKQIRL